MTSSTLIRTPKAADGPTLDHVLGSGLELLAEQLAATAVERDRHGGHAAHERELIRASGLLALTIAPELGGLGGGVAELFGAVRRLAQVDSALAHVLGFHHLQLFGVQLYGGPAAAQHGQRHLADTAEQRLFWGNALNPADTRLQARRVDGGYRLQGLKSFCSGALGSDRLTLSATTADGGFLIGIVPTRREGVQVESDWDAFGQRQTDSGTVRFDEVWLADAELLQLPGTAPTPRATLRSQIAQGIMAHLYLGIAEGAFDAARRYTLEHSKPWFASGVARAADDPLIQQRYGDLWLYLRPAQALADAAMRELAQALARGEALTTAERGAVAVANAESKVLAHRAAIEVSTQLFELTGARSTSGRLGLDRFWRNARVHTLHDPVDYKLRDLGRHVLDARIPDPTAYS
ncbi:acyl-CoA dehydrogenase family protein [Paucibacter sp. M5-1]|uniref:acyl-CoA dehydrogenase family protein n=1 Tax=Paucibacter sp. M5-1 TaxID=3015998 RepID=UPI0022B8E486|nr:acyl-CoA dehydrogenase family protein [Paucibacter sp. M5-1]MCZ7883568.1 acyl-CoA dehydrogenase family protein [Paucibacter sp. M5-1]